MTETLSLPTENMVWCSGGPSERLGEKCPVFSDETKIRGRRNLGTRDMSFRGRTQAGLEVKRRIQDHSHRSECAIQETSCAKKQGLHHCETSSLGGRRKKGVKNLRPGTPLKGPKASSSTVKMAIKRPNNIHTVEYLSEFRQTIVCRSILKRQTDTPNSFGGNKWCPKPSDKNTA